MENFLGAVGLMFFLFFVLAAAVEAILEVFRGILEKLGITWLKGKTTLEDTVKLATEFLPDEAAAKGRIQALASLAKATAKLAQDRLAAIEKIRTNVQQAALPLAAETVQEINTVAAEVKAKLDNNERLRIFWLRLISAIVGSGLAWYAGFDGIKIVAEASNIGLSLPDPFGAIVSGIAASSGSSYWHDQLDRVRSLKSASQELRKLTRG